MSDLFYCIKLTDVVNGIRHYEITLDGYVVTGMEIPVPGDNRTMVYIDAGRGYLLCGIMDIAIANMIDNVAGRVYAANIDEMLTGTCVAVSQAAIKMGAYVGMSCRDFIGLLCRQA